MLLKQGIYIYKQVVQTFILLSTLIKFLIYISFVNQIQYLIFINPSVNKKKGQK